MLRQARQEKSRILISGGWLGQETVQHPGYSAQQDKFFWFISLQNRVSTKLWSFYLCHMEARCGKRSAFSPHQWLQEQILHISANLYFCVNELHLVSNTISNTELCSLKAQDTSLKGTSLYSEVGQGRGHWVPWTDGNDEKLLQK